MKKTYGDNVAVNGLDLDIQQGEIFALLGPNGAGKTTTVEILEGYRSRSAGDVSVLDVDPGRATREWRERIGIVLQSTADETPLSAREYIDHVGSFFPDPRDTDELIELVGLSEKADERAKVMSGGQRRRLDVALGIVGRPEILFLDEPTTGFDPEARRAFWKLIESLRDTGTTILLTTHYLDEAEYLADRVGVIARGELVALDTPERVGGRQGDDSVVEWLEGSKLKSKATATPTSFVSDLAKKHAGKDGEIPGLQIRRRSLEDVYLELIADREGVHA